MGMEFSLTFLKIGLEFSTWIPVPEIWEWNLPFPVPVPEVQKSFPLNTCPHEKTSVFYKVYQLRGGIKLIYKKVRATFYLLCGMPENRPKDDRKMPITTEKRSKDERKLTELIKRGWGGDQSPLQNL